MRNRIWSFLVSYFNKRPISLISYNFIYQVGLGKLAKITLVVYALEKPRYKEKRSGEYSHKKWPSDSYRDYIRNTTDTLPKYIVSQVKCFYHRSVWRNS